ncbi:MAG: hypothetical protein KA735_04310 [Burkholderiaceae bacterium]|nr:hypothetical protein [Burkholderiaceae bacterium]
MNIATIGLAHHCLTPPSILQLSFMEPAELGDIDTVVWNIEALLPAIQNDLEQTNPKVLSVKGSEQLLAKSRHWRYQFEKLLLKGGTIIAFLPPAEEIGIHTLQEIMPYELLEPLPSVRLETFPIEGALLSCTAGEPFRSLFESISPLLMPIVALNNHPGTSILHDTEGQVLACYHALTPGRIIFLPALNQSMWAEGTLCSEFFTSVQRCIERFGQTVGISNARWLNDYALDAEQALFLERSASIRKLGLLQEQIQNIEVKISQQSFFKQLIGGEGPGVYTAVAELFRRQGAFVQSDWISDKLLIVELTDSYLAVQMRLADEPIDQDYLKNLGSAQARISDYFGRPVKILVADFSQNGLALPDRRPLKDESQKTQQHGFLFIEGSQLYGWHLEPEKQGIDRWVSRLREHDSSYTEQLSAIVKFNLVPAKVLAPHLTAKTSHHTMPAYDTFER